MAPRIGFTFLGRHENRWRVRLEMDSVPRGVTVGLISEDNKPLGPAMVATQMVASQIAAPQEEKSCFTVELSGPCHLPGGAMVRCTLDTVCGVWVQDFPVDARRGFHAFLMGDTPLSVESLEHGRGVSRAELKTLSQSFPWLMKPPCPSSLDPDLKKMLEEGKFEAQGNPDKVKDLELKTKAAAPALND